jgi:acyl carrier protein
LGGIRIELGEVETILLKHKDIEEAVVVPRKDEKDEPFLCAFVKAANDLGQSDFRESLARELPRYMLPTAFVELERIPRTPTGKVNRKLLETIDLKVSAPIEYAAPKTEKESLIAGIWKEVLNIDNVGIHDNFFDIGGNSLGIIQVNFKLKELFKRDIPALIMFEYPTIASIIDYLEKNPGGGIEPGQEDEEKDRTEVKGKGRNRMQQRRSNIQQRRSS